MEPDGAWQSVGESVKRHREIKLLPTSLLYLLSVYTWNIDKQKERWAAVQTTLIQLEWVQ